jgi:oligopeptide/dipeptide ABC transporter ATP-binding protein
MTTLLGLHGIAIAVRSDGGWHEAVRDATLHVDAAETLALVGESGSGKTLTALSAIGLLPRGAQLRRGSLQLAGRDMQDATEPAWRAMRGDHVAMVFQDPMTGLNPSMTVGAQVAESLRAKMGFSRAAARARAADLLRRVGLGQAQRRMDDYPHQFSGGMRQRVMIAMALACDPGLLIADEPTTALDATVQAGIIALLAELRVERGLGLLLVTHNFGLVAQAADRVAVMYAGDIVETGPVASILQTPAHPYTQALLRAAPRVDRDSADIRAIPGQVPMVHAMPAGCRFAPRCPARIDACAARPPATILAADGHRAACWRLVA